MSRVLRLWLIAMRSRDAGLDEPELLADELFLLCEGANISIESVGPEGPVRQVPRMIENMVARHTPRISA